MLQSSLPPLLPLPLPPPPSSSFQKRCSSKSALIYGERDKRKDSLHVGWDHPHAFDALVLGAPQEKKRMGWEGKEESWTHGWYSGKKKSLEENGFVTSPPPCPLPFETRRRRHLLGRIIMCGVWKQYMLCHLSSSHPERQPTTAATRHGFASVNGGMHANSTQSREEDGCI